jgi:hypothetical protein
VKKETRVYCEAVTLHVHAYDDEGLPDRRKPMADVTPDLIFQVANGFMAAKHLFVANEVGLFEALADAPAPLDDVAQRTGIPRRTLRIPYQDSGTREPAGGTPARLLVSYR